LNHFDLNEGQLIIPTNQETTFTSDYDIPNIVDVTLLDVSPHMHLLGKSISAWAVTPTNQTIPLIEIEDWDFHWQGFYDFRNPIRIPMGSTLMGSATYDNTSANPNNPNDPLQVVTAGESTTEEMMLIFFSWTYYAPGDESIVIDNSTHESHICETQVVGVDAEFENEFAVYPNPASNMFRIEVDENIQRITISDMLGRNVLSPLISKSIDVSILTTGLYTLTVEGESSTYSQRINILK
jgi:hypothetical protein